MCINRPECQRCETCGNRKYQLWISEEMHDRGCPFGFDRMDRCPDAVNRGRVLFWARENGAMLTAEAIAKIDQLLASGVDLSAPSVDFVP